MKKKWVLHHCDLDHWCKVTNFNKIRVSVVRNHLAKTSSKLVHSFSWNFVHKQSQTETQMHRQTHRQTAVEKNDPSTISRRCKNAISVDQSVIPIVVMSWQLISILILFFLYIYKKDISDFLFQFFRKSCTDFIKKIQCNRKKKW